MPFKIVQTIEKGKTVLTVVPSKWEEDGILSWPHKKNEFKLVYDEESIPKKDWDKINCIKKREYSTLCEAEREQEIMEQASDTDGENLNQLVSRSPKQRSRRVLHNTRVLQPIDLNDNIITSQNTVANIQSSSCAEQENIDMESIFLPLSPDDVQQVLTLPVTSTHNIQIVSDKSLPVTATTNLSSKSPSNASEPNSVSNYVSVDFAQLIENQQKIMSQLAVLQASVDFLMSKSVHAGPSEQPATSTSRLSIKPLNSKNDFEQLESKLKDETFYSNVVTELTFICGNSGKCKGIDSCYKLVDYFFTRQIFLQCNWTGSTRDANAEKKIPFKFYTKIRSCFIDIVRQSDVNFTENDADKFFKIVIKNAKPRLQNKVASVTRLSKSRAKKHDVEKLQGNGNRGDIKDSSPQSQQEPNQNAVDILVQTYESVVDKNSEENQREVIPNNEEN